MDRRAVLLVGLLLPLSSLAHAQRVLQVSSGHYHACALLEGGSVKCWGENALGQLGLGDTSNRGDGPLEGGNDLPTVNLGLGRTASQVEAGSQISCALLTDGRVKCWGLGPYLGMAIGTTTERRGDSPGEMGDALPLVELGAGVIARQIAVGARTACAITADNRVKCWGNNDHGLLGLGEIGTRGDAPGEMGDNLPYVNLGTGRTAVDIAVGSTHACVLLDNGRIRCWGQNGSGQLGIADGVYRGSHAADMGDNLPYVDLGTASGVARRAVALSAGYDTSCAVLTTGQVKCWGDNDYGTVGVGDTLDRGYGPKIMGDYLPMVSLGTGRTAVAIDVYNKHACALLDNARVKCWGDNVSGQLGTGDVAPRGDQPGEMGDSLLPVDFGSSRHVVEVQTGRESVCVLLDNGSVRCWGGNRSGQLLRGDTASRGDQPGEMGTSLPAVPIGSALQIASHGQQYCAALPDGRLKCWGSNNRGQLGLGDLNARGDQAGEMGASLPVVDLGPGELVKQVAVGLQFSCVLLRSNRVKCWGQNEAAYGQLGLGDVRVRGDNAGEMGNALPYVDLGTTPTPVSITSGLTHTFVLFADGSAKCWGGNTSAQCGIGVASSYGDAAGEMGSSLPFVQTPLPIRQIAAGGFHSCLLLSDGSVRCFGSNLHGQLGLGHTSMIGDSFAEMNAALQAVDLGTGRTAVAVAAGRFHSCAILDNGTVKCWGYNASGQLGLGNTVKRGDDAGEMGDNLPAVNLGAARIATAITANWNHTCAVLDDGSTKCWGGSPNGELGQGDTTSRGDNANEMGNALGVVSLGGGRVRAIASSLLSNCAVLDDDAIKCWGGNGGGELGVGDRLSRGDGAGEMGSALRAVDLGP